MGNTTKGVVALVAIWAMGCSEEEPPSCQTAVLHYYAAGCFYADLNGTRLTQEQVIGVCRQDLANAVESCEDDHDEWRTCIGTVPNASTPAQCMECNEAQEALLTCD